MSYILDALKKLEQKRQQGPVPDLMSIHAPERQKHEKRMIWPYIVLGVLVLNAGILAVVFRPWEADNKKAAAHVPVLQPVHKEVIPSAAPPIKMNAAVPDKKPVVPKSSGASDKHAAVTKKAAPAPKHENAPALVEVNIKETSQVEEPSVYNDQRSDEVNPSVLSMNPSPQQMEILRNKIREETSPPAAIQPRNDLPVNKKEAPTDEQVPDVSQLPEETKKELPNIIISAHIYSNNPGSRIVNINGSTIKEGDEVTKGLKVQEITMSGVIFDYHGRRFQVRAF